MKKFIVLLMLASPIALSSQIVSFETIIVINGEETPVLTQSSNRADLIEFLTSAIQSANITPDELGIEVTTADCQYVDVVGGNFDSAGSTSPYPNGVSPVFLSRKHVTFYNNTAFPATDAWIGLANGLNPANYIFKVVAIPK